MKEPLIFFMVFLLVLSTGFAVNAIIQSYRLIHSSGSFKRVGVEIWDGYAKANRLDHVEWGEINLNKQNYSTVDIYIESTSTKRIALRIFVNETDPATLFDWMALTTDYEGMPINPGEIIQVTLRLTIDDHIPWSINPFNFDIWIIGEPS